MKTTEIFVEQVIIGFLVLMIAALPFYPQIKGQSELVEGWEIFFSFAAAALGIAYMLGIVFDRFADSLVADLTEHQRRRVVDPSYWSGDYPEARLRIAILEAGGSSAEWHDYLRSRVRLSRALAVFLPGLSFVGVLALRPERSRWWLAMVLAAYAAAFFGRAPKSDAAKTRRKVERSLMSLREMYSSIGVSEVEAREFAAKLAVIDAQLRKKTPRSGEVGYDLLRPGTCAVAGPRGDRPRVGRPGDTPTATTDVALLVAVGGAGLTALAGWAWWRINKTYLTYLENFDRFRKKVAE